MHRTLCTHSYPGGQKIEIVQGDITQGKVDAIDNASNEYLMHGGGVAAIIARKGGKQIIVEVSRAWVKDHDPVSNAEPAYTNGGKLPGCYVIPAVGSVWGSGDEDDKLIAAITGTLKRANQLDLTSLAFPAISTGIFGFPTMRVASVIYRVIQTHYEHNPDTSFTLVRLTLFDQPTLEAFAHVYNRMISNQLSVNSNQ